MQTITVKIEDSSFAHFINLLKSYSFVSEIQVSNTSNEPVHSMLNPLIRNPMGKPSINDFSGFWSDNPKTLEQIRKAAWKRK